MEKQGSIRGRIKNNGSKARGQPGKGRYHRIGIREELQRRGSDWQYIFEMEHLPLHPTKPSLIEEKYPTVGHFEGKIFSSGACESGCYSC